MKTVPVSFSNVVSVHEVFMRILIQFKIKIGVNRSSNNRPEATVKLDLTKV